MAGSHLSKIGYAPRAVFPGALPARPVPNPERRRLATGVAIATGLVLAIAPVAVMAVMPGETAEAVVSTAPVEMSESESAQTLAIDPAIMAFNQDGATINLSLMAADDGQRVYVEDAANNIIEIPVSPGQTTVSAELPADFVASETLTIRVH